MCSETLLLLKVRLARLKSTHTRGEMCTWFGSRSIKETWLVSKLMGFVIMHFFKDVFWLGCMRSFCILESSMPLENETRVELVRLLLLF